MTCKGTFWQVAICLRPPPLLDFCLGWSNNFVGYETGRIQSVILLQNMVSNRTQHSTTPSQPHTVCVQYTKLYYDTAGGEGELNQREG